MNPNFPVHPDIIVLDLFATFTVRVWKEDKLILWLVDGFNKCFDQMLIFWAAHFFQNDRAGRKNDHLSAS